LTIYYATTFNQAGQEGQTHNSTYKKLAVQWLQDVQFSNETFVVTDNLRLRNRQLLVAAKRYAACYDDPNQDNNLIDSKTFLTIFVMTKE